MRKSTITKTWLGGIVAIALGLVATFAAVALILVYGGTLTPTPSGEGYDFVPRTDLFFWTMVSVIVMGGLLASVGGYVEFIAWIGALINSYQLADKAWFIVTLALGLLGFGLIAMIVYLIGAPDGFEAKPARFSSPALTQTS